MLLVRKSLGWFRMRKLAVRCIMGLAVRELLVFGDLALGEGVPSLSVSRSKSREFGLLLAASPRQRLAALLLPLLVCLLRPIEGGEGGRWSLLGLLLALVFLVLESELVRRTTLGFLPDADKGSLFLARGSSSLGTVFLETAMLLGRLRKDGRRMGDGDGLSG